MATVRVFLLLALVVMVWPAMTLGNRGKWTAFKTLSKSQQESCRTKFKFLPIKAVTEREKKYELCKKTCTDYLHYQFAALRNREEFDCAWDYLLRENTGRVVVNNYVWSNGVKILNGQTLESVPDLDGFSIKSKKGHGFSALGIRSGAYAFETLSSSAQLSDTACACRSTKDHLDKDGCMWFDHSIIPARKGKSVTSHSCPAKCSASNKRTLAVFDSQVEYLCFLRKFSAHHPDIAAKNLHGSAVVTGMVIRGAQIYSSRNRMHKVHGVFGRPSTKADKFQYADLRNVGCSNKKLCNNVDHQETCIYIKDRYWQATSCNSHAKYCACETAPKEQTSYKCPTYRVIKDNAALSTPYHCTAQCEGLRLPVLTNYAEYHCALSALRKAKLAAAPLGMLAAHMGTFDIYNMELIDESFAMKVTPSAQLTKQGFVEKPQEGGSGFNLLTIYLSKAGGYHAYPGKIGSLKSTGCMCEDELLSEHDEDECEQMLGRLVKKEFRTPYRDGNLVYSVNECRKLCESSGAKVVEPESFSELNCYFHQVQGDRPSTPFFPLGYKIRGNKLVSWDEEREFHYYMLPLEKSSSEDDCTMLFKGRVQIRPCGALHSSHCYCSPVSARKRLSSKPKLHTLTECPRMQVFVKSQAQFTYTRCSKLCENAAGRRVAVPTNQRELNCIGSMLQDATNLPVEDLFAWTGLQEKNGILYDPLSPQTVIPTFTSERKMSFDGLKRSGPIWIDQAASSSDRAIYYGPGGNLISTDPTFMGPPGEHMFCACKLNDRKHDAETTCTPYVIVPGDGHFTRQGCSERCGELGGRLALPQNKFDYHCVLDQQVMVTGNSHHPLFIGLQVKQPGAKLVDPRFGDTEIPFFAKRADAEAHKKSSTPAIINTDRLARMKDTAVYIKEGFVVYERKQEKVLRASCACQPEQPLTNCVEKYSVLIERPPLRRSTCSDRCRKLGEDFEIALPRSVEEYQCLRWQIGKASRANPKYTAVWYRAKLTKTGGRTHLVDSETSHVVENVLSQVASPSIGDNVVRTWSKSYFSEQNAIYLLNDRLHVIKDDTPLALQKMTRTVACACQKSMTSKKN